MGRCGMRYASSAACDILAAVSVGYGSGGAEYDELVVQAMCHAIYRGSVDAPEAVCRRM